MKKLFLFLSLFLFVMLSLFSQNSDWEDVIYLKNGGVLRGIIIEQVPAESIKIQTEDGNVHAFEMDEILKIAKEQKQERLKDKKINDLSMTTVSMNFQSAVNRTRGLLIGIKASYGSYITPHLSLGIGIGYNRFNEYYYFPLTLDLMIEVFHDETTPFVKFNGGLAISDQMNSPQVLLEPSFGIKHSIDKDTSFLLGIGTSFREYDIFSYTDEQQYYSSVKFSLGLAF